MKNNQNKESLIKTIAPLLVLLVIGIICLTIGIVWTVNTETKISNFMPTTATVIGYDVLEAEEKDESTKYAEVVEFTLDGVTFTVTNKVSSNIPAKVGTELTVYYNPDNPNDCVFLTSNRFVNGFILIFSSVYTTAVTLRIIADCSNYRRQKALTKKYQSTTATQSEDNK